MPEPGEGATTFTQADIDAAVAAANEGLEANRNEILAELKAAKETLKAFDGIDAKAHRAMKAQIAELETQAKAAQAGITSDKIAEIQASVRAQLEEEYAPSKTRVSELEGEVRSLRLDNVVKATMGKSGVRADRIDALFRLTQDRFDLTDDGAPMLKASPGNDVAKYIAEELEKEWPEFYGGSGSSGGGAPKSSPSGGGRVRQISRGDGDAFMANIDAIADGKIEVRE